MCMSHIIVRRDEYDSDAKVCCVLVATLVASTKGQLNPALFPPLLNVIKLLALDIYCTNKTLVFP